MVVDEATGHVSIWAKGGHYWKFFRLSFTTRDGRKMRTVPSVAAIADLGPRTPQAVHGAPADVTYDPAEPVAGQPSGLLRLPRPDRVSRPDRAGPVRHARRGGDPRPPV